MFFRKLLKIFYEYMTTVLIVITVVFILISTPFTPLFGQQIMGTQNQNESAAFQQALSLYKDESFKQAAIQFSKINSDEAMLFAGKSFFSAGYFGKARSFLRKALQTTVPSQKFDASYTLALCDFELHDFGQSLDRLYNLYNNQQSGDVGNNARIFYNEILDYLTLEQRLRAFHASTIPSVQKDIVVTVFDKVDRETAESLIKSLKTNFSNTSDSTLVQDLESNLDSLPPYQNNLPTRVQVKAPKGISYSLGVALPKFDQNSDVYPVSQGLYYGILMAVENFNKRNNDSKVFIHYVNTLKDQDKPKDIMTELAWNQHADMIIGPLYSEMAASMAPLAEQYQIPMLSPLANSDSLNIDNPYVYQANPTWAVRGKKMADFAVNRLHLDTLAVIVDKNSYGMQEAIAFRDEAEKIGAKVQYFFSDDFEANKFDVSQYDQYFSPDTTMIDSLGIKHVDAVYLPMTGATAPALINLIMTDFQAYRSNVTVLGSQEFATAGLEPDQISKFNIYYSGINVPNPDSSVVQDFNTEYQNRFGLSANKYSIIGFDCANFMLKTLERVQNPALLKEALKNSDEYVGLGSHYIFDGTHINQAVEFFKMTPNGPLKVAISN